MPKRIKRTGLSLEMFVHEKCAELLLLLPTGEARQAAVNFLQARVVHMGYAPNGEVHVPKPEDPRQLTIPTELPV